MFPAPGRVFGKTTTGLVYNIDTIMYTKDKFKMSTTTNVVRHFVFCVRGSQCRVDGSYSPVYINYQIS